MLRSGQVYATASEDMDSLTFGTPVLLRHLTFSEARKMPIDEYHYSKAVEGLEMTHDQVRPSAAELGVRVWPAKCDEVRTRAVVGQFIDLCILLGCDYCDSIRGIGPKKAVEFIKKYGNIEKVLESLDKTKYPIPDDWNYQGARELFKNPEVKDPAEVEVRNLDGKMTFCD